MVASLGTAIAALSLTGIATAEPVGRGYEMVTPASKPVEPAHGLSGLAFGATDDGQHVFFHSQASVLPDIPAYGNVYRSDRETGGWATRPVVPRGATLGLDNDLLAFSPDARRVIANTFNSYDAADTDDPLRGGPDLYAFGPGPNPELLSPSPVPDDGDPSQAQLLVAVTDDARGILFTFATSPQVPLVPVAAGAEGEQLYEFKDGTLRYVAVDSAGTRLTSGRTIAGVSDALNWVGNAYSRDGSRIFFTAQAGADPSDRPGLYVRTDDAVTDPIPAEPIGANAASQYLGAAPNGAFAYFRTSLPLTSDDHDSDPDLYVYETQSKTVSLLSSAVADGLEVTERPVWASDDGTRVYYTSDRIADGSPAGTYVWNEGTSRLIADTSLIPLQSGTAGFQCTPTRMTPDGRYFLAQTPAALLPADRDNGAPDVYRYDVVSGSWVLMSTGPSDGNNADGAFINQENHVAAFAACDSRLAHVTHPMSDDGRYVFFETRAQLVPDDANGRVDVYQWDAGTGKTSLITTGRGEADANFLDATPSGSDVFLLTRERLVRSDIDASADIYVARLGVQPSDSPPAVACRESECQGAPGGGFSTNPPGSATLDVPTPVAGARVRHRLEVSRLSTKALRRLASGRAARLRVVAAVDGRLTVTGRISVGRRSVGVPFGSTVAKAGTATTITLRLGRASRRLLGRRGTARLRLVVHQLEVKPVRATFVLPRLKGAAR